MFRCSLCEHQNSFMLPHVSDITRILDAIHEGDPKAAEELLPMVYSELRKLAAQKMARERLF